MALALLLLAGCGRHGGASNASAPPPNDLETAAIEAGVIPDPRSADLTGLYATDTDRLCIVPSSTAFRVGVTVDYGGDQTCSGVGMITRAGETLHLDFDGVASCSFDARFEGDRIVFPGRLPEGCQKLCGGRASLAGMEVDRLSESASEAGALRDSKDKLLCAGN